MHWARASGVEGGPLAVRHPEGLGLLLVYLMAALAMGLCLLGPLVCYFRTYGLLSQILTIASLPSYIPVVPALLRPHPSLPPNPQLRCASSFLTPPTPKLQSLGCARSKSPVISPCIQA